MLNVSMWKAGACRNPLLEFAYSAALVQSGAQNILQALRDISSHGDRFEGLPGKLQLSFCFVASAVFTCPKTSIHSATPEEKY